jgi:hypothetical protein
MANRLLVLACLLLSSACRRSSGPPSPEFEEAQRRRLELVSRHADDADGRPEMEAVLALLERVAPDSADAPLAAETRARIVEGRKRLAEAQARRDRSLAAAAPGSWSFSEGRAGEGAGGIAAGPPPLAPGLKLAAFEEAYGDCFEMRTPVEVQTPGPDGGIQGQDGEAWGLKGSPDCRERHPDRADQVVLFVREALVAVRPASELKRTEVQVPAKELRAVEAEQLPDGGLVPKRGADGGYIDVKDGGG